MDSIAPLLAHRRELLAYVRKRIRSPELAEDLLQDSLLRAMKAAPELRDEERILPWFYRILRNAIVDTYRHRAVEARVVDGSVEQVELPTDPGTEDEDLLCACFRELIPTLKPEYAELIERVELGGEDGEKLAAELGISRNNLKVRRHRARAALRERLEQTCRACARHGCLDCSCGNS